MFIHQWDYLKLNRSIRERANPLSAACSFGSLAICFSAKFHTIDSNLAGHEQVKHTDRALVGTPDECTLDGGTIGAEAKGHI